MDIKLCIRAIISMVLGLVLIAALLFIPAGTIEYWQGWLLIGILFVPMFIAGFVMMVKRPDLLRKRLNAREEQGEQRIVVALSGILFIASFVIAGLNYRFCAGASARGVEAVSLQGAEAAARGARMLMDITEWPIWFLMPAWASYAAAAVFIAGYALYAEVIRENAWLSRTVEVQEGQKVVDTGLYGIVRHPMYMSTLLMFLSMPVVLGSPVSFLIMLFYIPVIAVRIRNEEQVLEEGLEGYSEYKRKVRCRIVPFIW